MRKLIFILLFHCLSCASLPAQWETSHWFFGEHVGLRFTEAGIVPVEGGQLTYHEGTASMSDCRGELLFYTDGVTVWNREHQVMQNGMGLLGHYSATQSAIIVQHPGNCDLFYIFTVDGKEHYFENGLQYHLVDMSQQGGLGEVLSKNNRLYAPSSEKLTAVRHEDGRSVWVISHDMLQSDLFRCYLVTPSGLDMVPVLSAAGEPFFVLDALGQMKASPDGKRIGVANLHPQKAQVFDFDPSTGIVSNPILLPETIFEKDGLYGLEFSPDGNLLYLANHTVNYTDDVGSLYQFNLSPGNTADIINSGVVVGQNLPLTDLRGLQLGPDGKIYVSRSLGRHLGVVHQPDLPGLACDYVDKGVDLNGKYLGWTLPNFMVSYFNDSPEAAPNAEFSFVNDCLEDETVFTAADQGESVEYHWDFGDSETSFLPRPAHVFKDTGAYTVSLIARKNCCADTFSAVVAIKSCYEDVYVPSAFSPNDDGINDVFKPYGKGIAHMELTVYDRWGERIFESNQPGAGWDGRFKGKKMNGGVYVYFLALTFENGTQKRLVSNFTLLGGKF